MGEVKRQSILSGIFLVLHVLIGFVNIMYLRPRALSVAEIGLISSFLLVVGSMFSTMAQMGMRSTTIKFFPFFKDSGKKHNGFLTFAMLVPLIGILVVSVFAFFFEGWVIGNFEQAESKDLINQYYFLVFPLTFCLVYFDILYGYSSSLLKTAVPLFFRQVFVKTIIMILLFLQLSEYTSFDFFVKAYIATYFFQVIGLIFYLWRIGEMRFSLNLSAFDKKQLKEMAKYAGFTLMSGSIIYLILYIDRLMVAMMSTNELADAGIYDTFAYVGSLVLLPMQAITPIAVPLVAGAWKNNDLKTIDTVYRKSSLNQLIVGLLIVIGIWANLDHLVAFLGEEFAIGKWVAVYVALARFADVATGVNGGIIVTSKHYRFDFYFNIFLVFITIFTNYIFIKNYGLVGAALATLMAASSYNLAKMIFVWVKFKIQPFSWSTLKALMIGGVVILLNYLVPINHEYWMWDVVIRSLSITAIYGVLILLFRVSDDINSTILQLKKRFLG